MANMQDRLSRFRNRPGNYGSLTCILTHIIQHVGITPVVKDPVLRELLTELRFDGISNRFGCFFLHDLDITNGRLTTIPEEDHHDLLKAMGVTRTHQRRERTPVEEMLPSQDAITWRDLRILLNRRSPITPIKRFIWDPIWFTYAAAQELFCRFTYEYWLVHKPKTFRPLIGVPTTLKGAMEVWTLESAERRLNQHNNMIMLCSS
jgi:hypothetical protein